jgi:2-methylaconitate isomerase
MRTRRRAVFARGGTSKGLIFHSADLPNDKAEWDAIFLSAMGSPDAYGRQLNGMGGGLSSVSKVCVVGSSSRPDADVDYTFAQIQVKENRVDYSGNCGNMSSAIGPFAIDEGLMPRYRDGQVTVRVHNVNTRKIIHSTFAVSEGMSVEDGELIIPGVSGSGAPIRLDFLDPGGASTGKLLPTGAVVDTIALPGGDKVEASLVDAANACVFIAAGSVGLTGCEHPNCIDGRPELLERLSAIRIQASVSMGIASSIQEARERPMIPLIAVVTPPLESQTLTGEVIPASAVDLVVRMMSNGQAHRALPVTGSLCLAIASQIQGTIPYRLVRSIRSGPLRLGTPSGVVVVEAAVVHKKNQWHALCGSFYRTTRRLFEGSVCVSLRPTKQSLE